MKKILIGMPSGSGKPYPDTIFSIFYQELNDDIRVDFDMNSLILGRPVQIARNELLERFVKSDCTHLLFFDDDQVMNYDVIQKLVDADKDIVSGIVPLRHGDGDGDMLNIFFEKDGRLTHYTDLSGITEQVIEIANCGTGCVLLSRKVCQDVYKFTEGDAFAFERRPYVQKLDGDILEKYDYQDYNENWEKKYYAMDGKIKIVHIPISEDLRFFEKCKELGYKLYADVTAISQHFEGRPKRRKVKSRANLNGDIEGRVAMEIRNEYPFEFKEDDIVLDIGANVGGIPMWCADIVNRVYCYEPDANAFEKLLYNTYGIPNVKIFNKAVVGGKGEGKAQFNENKISVYSSLVRGEFNTEVDTIGIEDILEGVTKIKFDIEGGEYDMFTCDIPATVKQICGETHILKGERKDKHDKLVQYFKDQGFTVEETLREDGETFILNCIRC